MFGYVKPFKPDLRMCEFDTYKAVYCGLCHELGRSFGPFARFTLNYDFTFLALLAAGVSEKKAEFSKAICPANPLKKKLSLNEAPPLKLAASVAMIIFYYKICDNIKDNSFFAKIPFVIIRPLAAFYKRRAKKLYPEADRIIGEQLKRQFAIEKDEYTGVDAAADPTAQALAAVFESLAEDKNQKIVLSRFGYLLGRWIYLIDALDDFEDDVKKGGFNPYARKLKIKSVSPESLTAVHKEAEKILNYTITELAQAYELITIYRFKPILDNIVYLGLKNTREIIFRKVKEKIN